MCGIAGIFHLRDSEPPKIAEINRMLGLLAHRGPNESGVYLDDDLALGQVRLSIIDITHGTQPIGNEDQSIWIVCNGEIFNYLEIRSHLMKRGHHFTTATDTEVILHLYEEKGIACLEELNGQFALAIWDTRSRELFLARDRMGIRPLFYTKDRQRLIFASEIKAVLTMMSTREIEPLALDQIFTFWTTLPGYSVLKAVSELPPGHYLHVHNSSIEIQPFWQFPVYPEDEQLDWPFQEIRETTEELLRDSVRIRLRADVPIGCYLSGGLDSSALATMITEDCHQRLTTFGIRFRNQRYDEGDYQKEAVRFLGTDHQSLQVSDQELGAIFPEAIWYGEKPILRTAPVPLFLLSRKVHEEGYKVVLSGEGADEAFGGYNIFREVKVRRFWAAQPASQLRPLLLAKLYPYILNDPRLPAMLPSFFAYGLEHVTDPFYSHRLRWRNTSRLKIFFSSSLRNEISSYQAIEKLRELLPAHFSRSDYLTRAQYLEIILFLSGYLLSCQGDRMAMAHAVEVRLPYLDHRLIEFLARVPPRWKIKAMQEKYLLRQIFRPRLPMKILQRTKHPYRAPIRSSLLNCASPNTLEMLSPGKVREFGLFDPSKVSQLVQKAKTGRWFSESEEMALTGILSTQLIYDRFVHRFQENCFEPATPQQVIDHRSLKVLATSC